MLVGLKMDLREDPQTIGELLKTGQRPVTTQEVCSLSADRYDTGIADTICRDTT